MVYSTTHKDGTVRWVAKWIKRDGKRTTKGGFHTREEALAFETPRRDEVKAHNAEERKRKREAAATDPAKLARRAANIARHGRCTATETAACVQLASMLLSLFDVSTVWDGAHYDLALRPKGSTDDLWYGIQVKSTNKVASNGVATFNSVGKYPGVLVVCVLLDPLHVWIFNGSDIAHLKKHTGSKNRSRIQVPWQLLRRRRRRRAWHPSPSGSYAKRPSRNWTSTA